jgi:hypothetical protein
MGNPWLDIPLQDYEGHMNAPDVEQAIALADLFEEALRHCRPDSVAILGVAGGNGLDRIDTDITRRVLGIDIHPGYLDAMRSRYPRPPLTLLCADLQRESAVGSPVRLVHAALIFEHAGTEECLHNAVSLVVPNGYLSVVLQLRSAAEAEVSPTRYSVMQSLSGHFRIVDRTARKTALESRGFALMQENLRGSPAKILLAGRLQGVGTWGFGRG